MSLDLGALVGSVILDTVPFDRAYARVVRQFSTLGTSAEKAAVGTTRLDRGLAGTAASANTASSSLTRAQAAATKQAAAEQKAATAAVRHSEAVARVNAVTNPAVATTERLRVAQLRQIAAQERLDGLMASGAATTRSLASANAALIGSTRAVTVAQEAGAVASSKFRSGLMGAGKMALELGLLIGGIEIAKKAIEFVGAGKELTDSLNGVQAAAHATDAQMKAVRAQAIGIGKDLKVPKATAVDAADAINDLVRAGVSLDRAMGAARPALLLASAAQTDLAFSARILGDTLDEFQLPASEATHVANALAAGATSAGGGLEQMFDALKYVGPRARAVGIGVDDIVAAIADLSKAGIQGTIAGTGLAMMLQRIAAPTEKSQKALDDLGISVWDAQGRFVGLAPLIDQLSSAQKRFGPNAKRFLADISNAFGARAANVVAAFAGKGVEGYNHMLARIKSGDVEHYAALMNRGVGAGFRQLGKEATAAGIDIYQKLEPKLASAVNGIGTELPKAVHTAVSILSPFAHDVGNVLAPAWHAVVIVLGLAVGALKAVAGVADSMSGTLGHLATEALAVYAAFKVIGLSVAIFKGVQVAIILTRVRLLELATTYRTLAAAEATMGIGSVAAVASIGGVGAAAGSAALAARRAATAFAVFRFAALASVSANADQISAIKELVAQYKGATNSTDLSARAIIRWASTSENAILPVKMVTKDLKITADELATGVSGTDAQFKSFVATLRTHGKVSEDDIGVLNKLHDAFEGSAAGAKKHAKATATDTIALGIQAEATKMQVAALRWVADAHGNLVQVEAKSKSATDAATTAMQAQTTASTLLKQAMDLLNGVNESVETSTNAFSIALGGLRNKTALATNAAGKQSRSLNQNTVAGAQNRQMIVGLIDAAKTQAQATADQAAKHHTLGAALKIGNAQLKANEDKIRAAAAAAHLDKDATDKLITSLGVIAKVHANPKIDLIDKASAKAAAAHKKWVTEAAGIAALRPELNVNDGPALAKLIHAANIWHSLHDKSITLSVTTYGVARASSAGNVSVAGTPVRAAGGIITGPGTGTSDSIVARVSNGEFVVNAAQTAKHKGLLTALNAGIDGFAAGGLVVHPTPATASHHPKTTTTTSGKVTTETATLPGIKGIATVIKGQTGKAAAAMRDLSKAVNVAFDLKGVEAKLAGVKKKLADMKSYRSDVMGTLKGGFDSTQAGSVTDLVAGFSGNTATNKAYTAELNKLRGESKGNKTLTNYINQLAASGQTTTLQTLAGASKGDLQRVTKAVGANNASLLAGGNAAVVSKYGVSVSGEQKQESKLEAQQKRDVLKIDKLLHAITLLTKHPAQIVIDGKVIAHTVVHGEVIKVLDELGNHLTYGHH